MDQAADEDLMNRYRDGDARAFELLYARHKGPLYRYLLRQCGVAALAEELFQDVWMKLINARSRYAARAKFTTYLYHLAHNRLIDHYRRTQTGVPISYDAFDKHEDQNDADESFIEQIADVDTREPDNELDRRRLAQRLLTHITALPEAQREAFLLRAESGLSLEEIATVTGVNAETAKSRLRYALSKLRQSLSKD
ncbi:MAG: RNA polymerase sigma factor [Gammaproteobacteria bacterium]|nr:RNA polymerase sigma factor [Gammaproteobacteria bacterium]